MRIMVIMVGSVRTVFHFVVFFLCRHSSSDGEELQLALCSSVSHAKLISAAKDAVSVGNGYHAHTRAIPRARV